MGKFKELSNGPPLNSALIGSKTYLCLVSDPYKSNGGKHSPMLSRFYNNSFDPDVTGAARITHYLDITELELPEGVEL